ncbi:hypothetical protein BDV96DRAFT_641281 [Lophiotrema nucula]|uniref:Uncharacterized protein n=1 Tax=Lophiotrema nucula TaxID=690887 RepID=A0A6A5ZP00_9PLEO|nr:hypothetical protein BDV96DRAFT_641281 [Lophiotrema nucula]
MGFGGVAGWSGSLCGGGSGLCFGWAYAEVYLSITLTISSLQFQSPPSSLVTPLLCPYITSDCIEAIRSTKKQKARAADSTNLHPVHL